MTTFFLYDIHKMADAEKKFDWAEDASTPVADKGEKKNEPPAPATDKANTDGATTWLKGSEGLDEPEFDVNVKLADLQEDPNNPLYSVKSFEDLKL